MVTIMVGLACLVLGLLVGYLNNGIHIHNYGNIEQEAPTEYNESMVNHLDPEIRRYYDENNGLNKY